MQEKSLCGKLDLEKVSLFSWLWRECRYVEGGWVGMVGGWKLG